jgi:hypothetical protein
MRTPRRHRATAIAALLAAALAGCGAQAPELRRAAATTAVATAPNNTMSGAVSTCVRPRQRHLRGYTFDGHRLPLRISAGAEPRCRGGRLRILRIQALTVGGRTTYVRRGGCDRPAPGEDCSRQPTVHLRASDLEPVPLATAERAGNGAAVRPCRRPVVGRPSAVRRELDRMFYKQPRDLPGRSISGARWSNYGNVGRRFHAGRSLNYLLWNLPRTAAGVLPGGGIVEAVLAQGQRLTLCDVPGLTLSSFDRRGRHNGRVRFAYAKVANRHDQIYGWVMRGYTYFGRPFRSTLAAAP